MKGLMVALAAAIFLLASGLAVMGDSSGRYGYGGDAWRFQAAMTGVGDYGSTNMFLSEPPEYSARTCSGDVDATTAKVYIFGFRDTDGYCVTRLFYANTPDEAETCAKASCRTCSVENITGSFSFGSALNTVQDSENYCTRR